MAGIVPDTMSTYTSTGFRMALILPYEARQIRSLNTVSATWAGCSSSLGLSRSTGTNLKKVDEQLASDTVISRQNKNTVRCMTYSAGEEKSPLFIFLHDQLPFFLGETGRNSGKFLQVSPGNTIFSPRNTCISP